MRFLKFAVLAALFALPVSSVNAGIMFNEAITIDFSVVDSSLSSVPLSLIHI